MREFVLALCAAVAFLLPIGLYCLLLASINRRSRPLMASGSWDAVGLLFASSGFLVVNIPMLLKEFYERVNGVNGDHIIAFWLGHWTLWFLYFLLLITGSALLLRLRASKTMLYNVDPELFAKAIDRAVDHLGMDTQRDRDRLVIAPANLIVGESSTAFMEATPKPVVVANDRRHAELTVESFPAMCHITLHWLRTTPGLRDEVERELDKSLENAAPLDNPAAGWFMSVSGLFLGAVAAIILALVFLKVLPML